MQLDEHVLQVQEQLTAAAALGDEQVRGIAGALGTSIAPAVRLALLAAVSEAADEITSLLLDTPGAPAVSARLDGGEIRIEVSQGVAEEADPDDGEQTARISMRLSERLKIAIDTAASRDGISVNTWLVRTAGAAVAGGRNGRANQSGGGYRLTGYVNG